MTHEEAPALTSLRAAQKEYDAALDAFHTARKQALAAGAEPETHPAYAAAAMRVRNAQDALLSAGRALKAARMARKQAGA